MITACRGLSNARRGSPPQWALAVWQRDREIARADIHRGPERQREAGHIDAGAISARSTKNLLRRSAAPYMPVKTHDCQTLLFLT